MCVSGPCPPCPKMVSISCLCGKSSRVPRRCSAKAWSCAQICRRTLPCRIHTCSDSCHAGITHLTLTDECIQTEELRGFELLSLSLGQVTVLHVRGSVYRHVRAAGSGRRDRVPVQSGTVTRCVCVCVTTV